MHRRILQWKPTVFNDQTVANGLFVNGHSSIRWSGYAFES